MGTERHPGIALGALEHRGDPLADAAIRALRSRRAGGGGGGGARGDLLAAVEAGADAGDDACRAFIDALVQLPAWADPELLEHGRRIALSLGIPSAAVLLLGALTEVYAVPRIARVLSATGRLEKQTWRRVLETAQFIRDVHYDAGWRIDGDAIRAVARVRLIHAMVRARLDGSGDGRPLVDQSEMAFTLYAHSHVVRRGLEAIGFPLHENEARAHQHLWRLIGHLLGVDAALLPDSPRAEATAYERLYAKLVDGSTPHSRRLTVRSIENATERGRVPRGLTRAATRRLVGERLADRLAIEPTPVWSVVLRGVIPGMRAINAVRRAAPAMTRAFAAAGRWYGDFILAAEADLHEPTGVAAARASAALCPEQLEREGVHS